MSGGCRWPNCYHHRATLYHKNLRNVNAGGIVSAREGRSMAHKDFSDLKALLINCSIKHDKRGSHTQRLMNRVAGVMEKEGVWVSQLYALEHKVATGMIKDGRDEGLE